ncbi:hypothetical protein ABFX02_09G128041 [Erythranthe guttata]
MMTVTVISSKLFPIPIPIPIPIQMNLVFTIPSPFQTSKISCCFHPKPGRRSTSRMSGVPARDRVIDLGKYSGKMLGSLPSSYLRWVSKNLRAGDTEEWAKLADQVLTDPVYRDRIEWELADKILSGGNETLSSGRNAVSELLEISKRFGWDNEDKRGWSKVDFGLLGTSKGGRIPRLGAMEETAGGIMKKKKKKIKAEEEEEDGGKRRERRERVRRRMEAGGCGNKDDEQEEEEEEGGLVSGPAAGYGQRRRSSPFPGREALMNKVLLNRQNIV